MFNYPEAKYKGAFSNLTNSSYELPYTGHNREKAEKEQGPMQHLMASLPQQSTKLFHQSLSDETSFVRRSTQSTIVGHICTCQKCLGKTQLRNIQPWGQKHH
jgi:hypothetical protein